jgi:hypothetical protein
MSELPQIFSSFEQIFCNGSYVNSSGNQMPLQRGFSEEFEAMETANTDWQPSYQQVESPSPVPIPYNDGNISEEFRWGTFTQQPRTETSNESLFGSEPMNVGVPPSNPFFPLLIFFVLVHDSLVASGQP